MIYPGFIGASDTHGARTVNVERTINWFPEVATGTPKAPAWLVPTPGLRPFTVLGAGPVRALFAEEGRAWAVGGGHFYEIFSNATNVLRGAVGEDTYAASISSNGSDGQQLLIVSAGTRYIYSLLTNTLTAVSDENPGPWAMGAFVDGYFLALRTNSDQIHYSALENGLAWDPLDVMLVSQTTANVRAIVPVHRELWLLGTANTTVWADVGDADNPWMPIPGAFLQQGIGSRFGWAVVDDTLFWHGQSDAGGRVAYGARGYTPQRISTHAVEQAWSLYPTMSDTIAWAYQQRGHSFVCFYVPSAETTWVFDATTGLWHERARWNPTTMEWEPHLARCQCFAFDQTLVGDRLTGAVYALDPDTYTDGEVEP